MRVDDFRDSMGCEGWYFESFRNNATEYLPCSQLCTGYSATIDSLTWRRTCAAHAVLARKYGYVDRSFDDYVIFVSEKLLLGASQELLEYPPIVRF